MRKGAIGAGMLMLALSACGGQVTDNAAKTADAATTINLTDTPEQATAGQFVAVSNTAMSLTGDATVKPDGISFALDQSYVTGPVVASTAGEPYTSTDRWVDLFGVMPDTPVEIRPVTSQQVGAKAVNGGLCGAEKVGHIALVRKNVGTPSEMLLMAAFKGAAAPGTAASPNDFCGTFNYAPATT